MTETQWLACEDPVAMLEQLPDHNWERKFRLFACACCRQVWHLLSDERSRRGVEVAELYADEHATDKQLNKALVAADLRLSNEDYRQAGHWVAQQPTVNLGTRYCLQRLLQLLAPVANVPHQADLLRDVCGPLPFRAVHIAPACLSWDGGAVVNLARSLYEERQLPAGTLDPTRLHILADALEDAGCTDAEILTHLRSDGDHVRGCWLVDLLVGKK
jgi:hypothetical protein